ncbi:tail fiber protein [Enterobacter phage Ec_L1]|uniref:Tail fiber protein n=1 Tax=Enterobacter phage Ec_L1 TaxID=2070180 RepID=A0A2P0WA12_9CAUD|nr:tail fiber protein [Enterobacter phage Ec_L1]AUV57195.1 tail fiber protein [Enterobacter phage Ec_L1]
MAIYRKGEASLAADGTVTGYGTTWKDQLALIRIGATVVFLSGNEIGAIGTISAIVSDTQIQTIQTDGATVSRGKYFILLHDSLTVDGLAQNVAETLRYYQSSETEIAEAMDYFKTFDWEKFEAIAKGVKTNAEAAKVSETNAKASETNAKQSESAASSSKNAAAASQAAAKTSETNAKTSETNAKASENAANGSKVAAAGSATAADNSAKAAASSQAAAKTSETNSKSSETNAKSSENAALQSKNAAAGSATAAKTSETNAKSSETKAKTSETNSKTSETNAKNSEINAENWAKSVNPANLAQLDAENTFQKKQTFNNTIQLASSYAIPMVIQSANPTIRFNETDKPSGAPDYALVFDGGNFRIQKEDGGGENILSYDRISNTVTLSKGGFADKAGTRNNLDLGTGNTPEFGGLYLTGGSLEVRRYSDDSAPSGSLVARRARANGTTIVSSEMRANPNGSVEWIKRDAGGTPRSISLSENNEVVFNGLVLAPPNIEIGKANSAGTSYIDLHYDGTKNYDYSARISCDGMNREQSGYGNLRFNAGFMSFSAPGGHRFDYQTTFINDGAPIVSQARSNGQSSYLLFKDGASNYGYVGFPSAASKDITLYNYTTDKGIKVSDKFYADNMDAQIGGNIMCYGSSVYVRGGSGASNTHLWLANNAGRNRAVFFANDNFSWNIRADNGASGASGQALSFNGSTGEARATTFTNTSDERAKFWIKPVTSALDKICSLRGVTYSMHPTLQSTVRNAGVIAQDVRKVLPEAVKEGNHKDVLDKNCQVVENPLSLDYNALAALYVEAIKELKTEIDALKEEVKALKGE